MTSILKIPEIRAMVEVEQEEAEHNIKKKILLNMIKSNLNIINNQAIHKWKCNPKTQDLTQ